MFSVYWQNQVCLGWLLSAFKEKMIARAQDKLHIANMLSFAI